MTFIVILIVAAIAAFAYLTYRVGWKEAGAAVAVFAAAIWAAIAGFSQHFTP